MDWRTTMQANGLLTIFQECFHPKGTQGFIHCCWFKAASLATKNKQMLSTLATHDA